MDLISLHAIQLALALGIRYLFVTSIGMAALSQELGYLARRKLSVLLDHESPLGRDWMGLADKMQFTYSTILALKGERSPTLALLDEWEKAAGEYQPLSDECRIRN